MTIADARDQGMETIDSVACGIDYIPSYRKYETTPKNFSQLRSKMRNPYQNPSTCL
jgi:hypothetical protein